jgi:hypothetical protein
MALLEFQVCQKWVANFEPEEGAAFTATFQQMRSEGDAYITGYSAQTLREMHDRGLIRWGESEIQQDKLRNLNLPLDPGFDLSGPFQGPPIFVRQPEDGDRIAIMNGNHRTAKVLLYGAPLSASIYVLELASPEASERLLGTAPLAKYTSPRMPDVFNYSLNSTYTG